MGLWVASVCAVAGCGTDAEGVAECRAFERVRCQAAAACGYPNVAECERTARDQCLHGVALARISATELDACTVDVGRAGRCAAGQGEETLATACSEPVATGTPNSTACEVVLRPELATSCAVLVPTATSAPAPTTPAGDAGS
jgi:hypothetical protein